MKKVIQCICISPVGCQMGLCIDMWWSVEAQFMATLFFGKYCWKCFSPFCINADICELTEGLDDCAKGIKFCFFSCGLGIVSPFDGIYNSFMLIKQICGNNLLSGVSGFKEVTANAHFMADKLKDALKLYTGNEPLRSMGEFAP